MVRSGLLCALLIVIAPVAGAQADIYRWKDAAGVTHFTNTAPPAGATLIEIIEEKPYDAAADRKRLEEDRRLRLEREKHQIEERQAAVAVREREAQLKLEEASRRLEEAEQQVRESEADGGRDDGFLRHGTYGPFRRYHRHQGPGDRDLYRGYRREGGSLYYEDPRQPKPVPHTPPPGPADRPGRAKEGPSKKKTKAEKPPAAAAEELLKEKGPARAAPAQP
jgi:hypothetical protein